jgi:hypothetical protein
MKRHEIRAFLETKGIYLWTISNRSLDFLLLFKQLHKNKCKELKALVERKGGMIFHMYGTHRAGGRVIFVLQEELDNIVIDADLIPSEAKEYVNPILLEFKKNLWFTPCHSSRYGKRPCVECFRDFSEYSSTDMPDTF